MSLVSLVVDDDDVELLSFVSLIDWKIDEVLLVSTVDISYSRYGYHSPSVSVRCSICLAVFMISALIWKEREAEIMSAISSTTFTLG